MDEILEKIDARAARERTDTKDTICYIRVPKAIERKLRQRARKFGVAYSTYVRGALMEIAERIKCEKDVEFKAVEK
jgi:predicted DNA binding CopG/RHH family protein